MHFALLKCCGCWESAEPLNIGFVSLTSWAVLSKVEEENRFPKMPMFHISRDGHLGFESGNNGGRILDLDTAVRDGILGGVVVSSVGYNGGVVDEKLDLKDMINELNISDDVPSVFICPISLEPMQEPVTLCTGQTYEKSNILKWFSLGHCTCPTTMQELWDDTVTPNKTLYQLIYTWFSQKYVQMKKRSQDAQGRAIELLNTLKTVKGKARIDALKELKQIVSSHSNTGKNLVDEGGVSFLCSLLGPLTSYSVGCEVVSILVKLNLSSESKKNLMQPAKISSVVDILNEGSIETKLNCIRLMEKLMEAKDFRAETVSSLTFLVALMRLVRDKRYIDGRFMGLNLLKSISMHEQVRRLIISTGALPQLVELIPDFNQECTELTMMVLDALSSVPEGKQALKDCPNTIPNIVKLLMKTSDQCTEHVLSILWRVCKLAPEECSSKAVDAGLAVKLLLVIQSGCDSKLKQRASELLKLCSSNCSDTVFISKCKLTRTIQ